MSKKLSTPLQISRNGIGYLRLKKKRFGIRCRSYKYTNEMHSDRKRF